MKTEGRYQVGYRTAKGEHKVERFNTIREAHTRAAWVLKQRGFHLYYILNPDMR